MRPIILYMFANSNQLKSNYNQIGFVYQILFKRKFEVNSGVFLQNCFISQYVGSIQSEVYYLTAIQSYRIGSRSFRIRYQNLDNE